MLRILFLPMSRGGDEVETAVYSAVGHLASVDTWLCVKVILKLAVDVIGDRLPAVERIPNIQCHEVRATKKQITTSHHLSMLMWERYRHSRTTYQLLLSTASPNPGVSTMVSNSWTPPSFISTLDCSTWGDMVTQVTWPQTNTKDSMLKWALKRVMACSHQITWQLCSHSSHTYDQQLNIFLASTRHKILKLKSEICHC